MQRDVRLGDRIFRRVTEAAGLVVLLTIAAIAVFLVAKAMPALRVSGWRFFTEKQWFPDATPAKFGVAALAFGTVLAAVLALVIVVPIAVGAALAVTELAPKRVGTWLGYLIDLLAAVPSVVYGLWAFFFLIPRMEGLERWLARYLNFIPLFANPSHSFGKSVFAASVVLAIMTLPIVAAIAR